MMSDDERNTDDRVFKEQLSFVNTNVQKGLMSSVVLGAIALYISFLENNFGFWVLQSLLLLIVLLFRAVLLNLIKKRRQTRLRTLKNHHFTSAILSSIFYSTLALSTLWFEDSGNILIVYIIIAGVCAGAVSAYSSLKHLANVFTLPVLCVLFIVSFIKGGESNYIVAFTTALFAFFMSNIYGDIYEKLYQSFKRSVVIKDMTTEKLKMQEKEEVKRDFYASMSHEIRTPLNGVFGLIDILETTELSIDQKDYLNTIRSSSHDLLKVVNDVVDLSKIESGKFKIDRYPFVIREVFEGGIRLFNQKAEEKQARIKLLISENVPRVLEGDDTRLKQVFANLLSNAIKYTRNNSSIDVEVDYLDGKLYFQVKDEGVGIPEDRIDTIFDRYTQINESKKDKKFTDSGTGLGLAICKELVVLMSGIISFENNPSGGACFKVEIPLSEGEIETSEPILKQKEISFNLNILVVDDREINLKVTKLLLKSLGVDVFLANDGLEARDFVLKNYANIDLVFMDLQMPVMNGIEATQEIRAKLDKEEAPYIVALTAQVESNLHESANTLGFDDYLTKPVNRDAMIKVLSDYQKLK